MTTGSHAGNSIGDAVKKGVGLVHGTGEALRGNFNAAVDSATGDRESAQRHQDIASHGAEEIDRGYHHQHGTGAGVTPVDLDRCRNSSQDRLLYILSNSRNKRAVGGHAATSGSTNHGSHGTNMGNEAGPPFDSDKHTAPRYA